MNLEILINVESKEIRCAFQQNGIQHGLVIERKNNRQLTGNIYRGKVANILHNIQSAFIYIHEGDNGFIHISDFLENTQKFLEMCGGGGGGGAGAGEARGGTGSAGGVN